MNFFSQAAKAIFGAIAAGVAALGAVLINGNTIGDVTDAQWVVIIGAVLAAGYGVYQTPNAEPTVQISTRPPPAPPPVGPTP